MHRSIILYNSLLSSSLDSLMIGRRSTCIQNRLFADAPRLKLGLGELLNPSDIFENDDIYIICSVDAFPSTYKISWFLNDREILMNSSSSVLISDDHLVIRKVSRQWTGLYSCRASNVVGDAVSNKLDITIKCKTTSLNPPWVVSDAFSIPFSRTRLCRRKNPHF